MDLTRRKTIYSPNIDLAQILGIRKQYLNRLLGINNTFKNDYLFVDLYFITELLYAGNHHYLLSSYCFPISLSCCFLSKLEILVMSHYLDKPVKKSLTL